ncbi:MAG: beta-ketoacyl-ACP synthase II [Veillonellaceae bacterium]|nr:beta-ketoacyl-ACP synthase II [Veillonellaceae bacterium]
MKKRVAVTGLGVVSPVGNGKEEFWQNLLAGVSGIGQITAFDTTGFDVTIAGEVKDFDPGMYMDKKAARKMDRFTQFAVAAAGMAIQDAGLDMAAEDADRIGAVVGSGIGGIGTIEDLSERIRDRGPSRVSPFSVPMMIANMAAGQISIEFGIQGPVITDVTACASGTNAIGDALRMIRYGDADVVIAGGTEAAVTPLPMAGFAAMKALSTRNDDPEHASRPFDAERDGFVLGEGAGMLVLEDWDHALARGAHIYAELCGYGSNADAYHITAPAPEGRQAKKCMEIALADAAMQPEDIDYINAHGTSTALNDKNETLAIRALFGAHADKLLVNSTKSMTGHLLGAAGAIEAIVLALSLQESKVHMTRNLQNPDPDCDLDYVAEGARDARLRAGISNSFGFGGQNAVIVMRKYEA